MEKLLSFGYCGKIIFLFHFQMKVEWIPLLLFLFVQIEKVENDLSETRLAKQFLINVVRLAGKSFRQNNLEFLFSWPRSSVLLD